MKIFNILILGGYGNFGKRIAQRLAKHSQVRLLIAGRNTHKAEALCRSLIDSGARAAVEPIQVDILNTQFSTDLQGLSPDLVIHTSGPFQGQDYNVPRACLDAGCHYIDLADDRRFVCDITQLNQQALDRNLLFVSGASSVPGLSSAVINKFINQFRQLDTIDYCIAPGNKAERGVATVKGILSYTGRPFKTLENGSWVGSYGWMSPRTVKFDGPIGKRWLANVDIPDLELFPKRYKNVRTVQFQAGLELPFLHLTMVGMAYLAKFRLVSNWAPASQLIFKMSQWFNGLGTDTGGMRIVLAGTDADGHSRSVIWTLTAEKGVGPYIPTISAIILAEKLMSGNLKDRGAKPCVGLFSLAEFDQQVRDLDIYTTEVRVG